MFLVEVAADRLQPFTTLQMLPWKMVSQLPLLVVVVTNTPSPLHCNLQAPLRVWKPPFPVTAVLRSQAILQALLQRVKKPQLPPLVAVGDNLTTPPAILQSRQTQRMKRLLLSSLVAAGAN